MSYVGYVPATVPFTADQIKPLGDQMYRRMDGANMPLDTIKNGFINGAFDWNQRGQATYTATSTAPSAFYGVDRWGIFNMGPNGSVTMQSLAFGLGDVSSESEKFIRISVSGQSAAGDGGCLYQPLESARRFAGKRCVLTGKARRYSGAGSVSASLTQNLGTGGSAQTVKYIGSFTPTAVWAPFSMIVDVPALTASQTLGTNSWLNIRFFLSAGSNFNSETNNLGLQTISVDFADLELKEILPGYGDQFPGFERIPREIELLRCQRYYEAAFYEVGGYAAASNYISGRVWLKAQKRIVPTIVLTNVSRTGTSSEYIQNQTVDGFTVAAATTATQTCVVSGNFTANAEI